MDGVLQELMNIVVCKHPDEDMFRCLLRQHPQLVNCIDHKTSGSLLHNCAKWDTLHRRQGQLTYILLYEFHADPNIHYNGSLALYWAADQINGACPDYEAAKLILQHRHFSIASKRGQRGCAISVMCIKFRHLDYLITFMLKTEKLRRLKNQRVALKKALAAKYAAAHCSLS